MCLVLTIAALALAQPVRAAGKAKRAVPAISIGNVRTNAAIDRATLELSPDTKRTRAVLTLSITSAAPSSSWHSRGDELELLLPEGAKVLGLALTVGSKPRIVAKPELGPCDPSNCIENRVWRTYVDRAYQKLDAALLQYGYANDGVAHYTLNVSSLRNGDAHVLEIEMELPPGRQLEVASGSAVAQFAVTIDGAAQQVKPLAAKYKPIRIALPKPKQHDTAADPLVPRWTVADGMPLFADGGAAAP